MGVQLRIHRPRRVLAEHRRGDASGVDLQHPVGPTTGHRSMTLEPAQSGFDCGVVGGKDLGPHERVRRQCPQHRDRLRCRERRIETPSRPVPEPPAQRRAGAGMPRLDQRTQIVADDRAVHTQRGAATAPPPPRWLVRVQVVVHRPPARSGMLPVLGQAHVVGEQARQPRGRRRQRRDAHHHDHHPHRPPAGSPARPPVRANALVCSSMPP